MNHDKETSTQKSDMTPAVTGMVKIFVQDEARGDEAAVIVPERQAFEAIMENECGTGSISQYLSTDSYKNSRVNDYRDGWAWAMKWMGVPLQLPGFEHMGELTLRAHELARRREVETGEEPLGHIRALPASPVMVLKSEDAAAQEIEALKRQLALANAKVEANKWGYEYLQDRMKSIDRPGWAHDCDGEIQARIKTAADELGIDPEFVSGVKPSRLSY